VELQKRELCLFRNLGEFKGEGAYRVLVESSLVSSSHPKAFFPFMASLSGCVSYQGNDE
jgi:hypothetical protein